MTKRDLEKKILKECLETKTPVFMNPRAKNFYVDRIEELQKMLENIEQCSVIAEHHNFKMTFSELYAAVKLAMCINCDFNTAVEASFNELGLIAE